MMKEYNIKTFLIVIVPMLLMAIIAIMFSHKDKNYNVSLIVNGIDYWKYNNKKWTNLETSDEIDWKKYDIYSSNKYINSYYVTINNNKTYFFDSNNDSYDVEPPYLAITSKSNIKILNFKEVEFNDSDNNIINFYLRKIKINYEGEYSKQKKYITDINNDNKEDYLYIISNELYTDKNVFYLVFAKYNNKIIAINNQINKDIFIHYDISWILNMQHNGFNNIILTEPKEYNTRYYLYTYNIDEKQYYNIFED